MIGGLNKLPREARDFSSSKVLGKADPSVLPEEFIVGDPITKDQKNTDLCTAYVATSASEVQEGIELNPQYQFAKTKQVSGKINSWGANLRDACKAIVKFGSLAQELFHITEGIDELRDWRNWPPKADRMAEEHKKKSYLSVDGFRSKFDAIRSAIWQNRGEKCAVLSGGLWNTSWSGNPFVPMEGKGNSPHAFLIIGWAKKMGGEYLIAHLSNGKEIGEGGRFYLPKRFVDRELKYGNFILFDMDPEEVKKRYWSIWQRLINFFKKHAY